MKRFFTHTKIYEWPINTMKSNSTLFVTKKMQIKVARSYHYACIRMAMIKRIPVGKDMEQLELVYLVGECTMVQPLCNVVCQFLIKLKIHL